MLFLSLSFFFPFYQFLIFQDKYNSNNFNNYFYSCCQNFAIGNLFEVVPVNFYFFFNMTPLISQASWISSIVDVSKQPCTFLDPHFQSAISPRVDKVLEDTTLMPWIIIVSRVVLFLRSVDRAIYLKFITLSSAFPWN